MHQKFVTKLEFEEEAEIFFIQGLRSIAVGPYV